nr:RloB family protein [Thermosulfidibacter takaii]
MEGQSEKWYLDLMRRHERPVLKLKPELQHQISLRRIKSLIAQYVKEGYDAIWWVVDMDTYKGKLDAFRAICDQILRRFRNVYILINSPCFETWLLLHYQDPPRYTDRCEMIIRLLKQHPEMANYDKSEKFYCYTDPDIYLRLKPFQKEAIARAKALDRLPEGYTIKAQIYKVIESVLKD